MVADCFQQIMLQDYNIIISYNIISIINKVKNWLKPLLKLKLSHYIKGVSIITWVLSTRNLQALLKVIDFQITKCSQRRPQSISGLGATMCKKVSNWCVRNLVQPRFNNHILGRLRGSQATYMLVISWYTTLN